MTTALTGLIVTYNSEELIADCVRSTVDAGVERVIVWDNSPNDRTRTVLSELGDERVSVAFDGRNHGFGGGVNRAFANSAAAGMIILVNPDCLPNQDAVSTMARICQDPSVGVVSPRMVYPSGENGIAGGRRPTMLKELLAATRIDDRLPRSVRQWLMARFRNPFRKGGTLFDSLMPGEPLDVDWVSGFCAMTTAEHFKAVGGMDEDYFLYFEDVDFALRLSRLGLRNVIARDVAVQHIESTSTSEVGKSKHYWNGYATYLSKNGGLPSQVVARLLKRWHR